MQPHALPAEDGPATAVSAGDATAGSSATPASAKPQAPASMPGAALSTAESTTRDWHYSLLDRDQDLLLVVSVSGELLHASDAFSKILGLSPSAMMGMPVYAIVHPEDATVVHELLYSSDAQRGGSRDVSLRLKRENGTYAWIHFRGRLHLGTEGTAGTFVCVGREYSCRNAMHTSGITNNIQSNEFVSRHNLFGIFTYSSGSVKQLLG